MKTLFNRVAATTCSLSVALLLFAGPFSQAQTVTYQDFEAEPGTAANVQILPAGWDNWNGFGRWFATLTGTIIPSCEGDRFAQTNLWSSTSSQQSRLEAPEWISNGESINITFDYKIIEFAGGAATPPGWGFFQVQYSIDGGDNWTTALTVDDSNHVTSTECSTLNLSIDGANVPAGSDTKIRWFGQWVQGDFYLILDEVSIIQEFDDPPLCVDAFETPEDGLITESLELNWSTPEGGATSYQVSLTNTTTSEVAFDGTAGLAATVSVTGLQEGITAC